MSRKLFAMLAGSVLALSATSVFAGQVMLFEGSGFKGRSAVATDAVPDLGNSVLGGSAGSLIITDGTWEACTDTYFRGRCGQLIPGNYAGLSGNLNGAVLSVRQIQSVSSRVLIAPDAVATVPAQVVVSSAPPAVVVNPAPATVVISPTARVVAVPAETTQIVPIAPRPPARAVLFQFPNFGGPSAVVEYRRMPDIDWTGFRYPAASIRIESGNWFACTEMGYRGQCSVLGPGDYPSLTGALGSGIVSMQPVA